MAVVTVQFRSEAMGRQVSYNIILPEGPTDHTRC